MFAMRVSSLDTALCTCGSAVHMVCRTYKGGLPCAVAVASAKQLLQEHSLPNGLTNAKEPLQDVAEDNAGHGIDGGRARPNKASLKMLQTKQESTKATRHQAAPAVYDEDHPARAVTDADLAAAAAIPGPSCSLCRPTPDCPPCSCGKQERDDRSDLP